MKTLVLVILLLGLGASVSVPAGSAEERWRVVARGTDTGDQVAVAAAAKRRVTAFAVRVRVMGEPKSARLHAVVTCSKVGPGPGGHVVSSGRQEFTMTAPAMRVLRLPMPYPENCGVTAIGIASGFLHRVGNATAAHITVEILVPCIVQRNGVCF
jgi:hypothetical protein